MNYQYTIIIPHRGPKEYLDRCLASIPKREDVQIIVVIDQEGKGAGWARNEGLKKAEGKYIIFADSDDFFHPCFSQLLDTLKPETSDVVYFNADSIDLTTQQPSWRANHLNRIFKSKDNKWKERHLRFHFTEPWCKAVRRSLIEQHAIHFDQSKILNDIYFSTQVGIFAKTIAVYNTQCYCVCNHSGSTAKRKKGIDKIIDYTRETAKSNMLLRRYGISHHHSRMLRPFFSALLHLRLSLASRCWNIMRTEGYSVRLLTFYILRYPRDLTKLIIRKLQSGELLH